MSDHHRDRGVLGGGAFDDRGGHGGYCGHHAQHQQQKQPALMHALKRRDDGQGRRVDDGSVLAGTVIALVVATPVLVIFSPVLVGAAIALALMSAGFVASGGLGMAALLVKAAIALALIRFISPAGWA